MNTRMKVRTILIVAGAVVAFVAGCATGPTYSYQPYMQNAVVSLQYAQNELRQAEPNKGGHRERALGCINQALDAVQAGIDWAAAHGN
jgi:hypothetical protein